MYKLTSHSGVIRTSDGAYIPEAPGNRDWDEYQGWLDGGGVPEPYVPPPPTQDELDKDWLKTYDKLIALKERTPQAVVDWIDQQIVIPTDQQIENSVTDLASTVTAFKTIAALLRELKDNQQVLAAAVSYLAKRI